MDRYGLDLIIALAAYVAAMALLCLLAAVFRASGLQRHGLIETVAMPHRLADVLKAPRRFVVAIGTWYLGSTVVTCVALARTAQTLWPTISLLRLYVGVALAVGLVWAIGGAGAKWIGAHYPLNVVRILGRTLLPLHWLFTPWTALLVRGENTSDDTQWATESMPHLSDGEIRSLLHEEDDEVNLEVEEREMIQSIFGFHEISVREIMVPRIDVVALEADATLAAAVAVIDECLHSRIPVHHGSVEKITGLLYSKDLLGVMAHGDTETRTVEEFVRPAYYIPESKRLDEVLEEFRAKRIHMAVVIDEYGGTAGLVTLEDVLEEIVGEIEDEFDVEDQLFEWIDDRSLKVDPKIDLDDLHDILGVELPLDDGSETLAGLVYEAAGKVPADGDEVEIAGLKVRVIRVEDQRILEVLITAAEPLPGAASRGDG
jgi:putative hemolysin